METVIALWLLGAVLVATGIAGMLLPALPGPPLLFAGFFVAAWAEDFEYVGYGVLAMLAVMSVLAYLVDFIAGALGAKHFGASSKAAIGAAIGALVGIFFGLPGILLGPFIGAVLGVLIAPAVIVPLVILAGLFIWLKLTEEADEEALELEQEAGI